MRLVLELDDGEDDFDAVSNHLVLLVPMREIEVRQGVLTKTLRVVLAEGVGSMKAKQLGYEGVPMTRLWLAQAEEE